MNVYTQTHINTISPQYFIYIQIFYHSSQQASNTVTLLLLFVKKSMFSFDTYILLPLQNKNAEQNLNSSFLSHAKHFPIAFRDLV